MYCRTMQKGIYIRSKPIWIEKGEKSTLYFYNLETKYQSDSNSNQISDENNTVYTDNDSSFCNSWYAS